MSAPHDPWKDARQWAEQGLRNARVIASTKTGQERIGWLEDVQYWQSLVDALVSQAETIRQGAAEIATLRAQNADYVEQHGKVTRCLAARTVERDALRSTVDQQQVRITALEAALERIAAMDFDANEDGRRNLYSGAARFVSAWLIARQALETP